MIDKVYCPTNLHASYTKVAANGGAAGVDHVTIDDYTGHLTNNQKKVETQLRDETYWPQAIRRTHIPKPGTTETRPLGIPTVRDRIVQGAVRHVLEPIFEQQFAEHRNVVLPKVRC